MALIISTPVMTSNTAPSGVVSVDAGSTYKPTTAYYMFKSIAPDTKKSYTTTVAALGNGGFGKNAPHWVQYDFGSGVTKEVLYLEWHRNDTNNSITDYSLFGSNNGSDWDTLLTVTGFTDPGSGVWTYDALDTTGDYRYYRFQIDDWTTSGLSDLIGIGGVILWVDDGSLEVTVEPVSFDFDALAPDYADGSYVQVESTSFTFTEQSPEYSNGPYSFEVPVQALTFTANATAPTITPDEAIPYSIIYRAYLEDLELPIGSYQARYRNGSESYLAIVVPDGATYADAINARSTGEIILKRGLAYKTGDEQLVEIIRVDLENIRDDWGGSKRSITLDGHATFTNTAQKEITLSNVSYRFSGTGKKRYRADLDLNLRPGDIAVYDAESITVGTILYTVSPSGEEMEVTEA